MATRLGLNILGVLATGILAGATVGCGSGGGLEEAPLSGRVTYQGKPIEKGRIRFIPIKGTKGPAQREWISQGKYSVTARGGLTVGTHRVEIDAYRPIPGARPYTEEEADGQFAFQAGDRPEEQYLPKQYNRDSTLEVTIEPGSGRVTKGFELR